MICPKAASATVTSKPLRLILGSASPRRLELLDQIGIKPAEVRPANIDEDVLTGEAPRAYVKRISRAKLEALGYANNDIHLCADTTVAIGRRILGKPQDQDQAVAFLSLLSGRKHTVITTVCVGQGGILRQKTVETKVQFKRLSITEIKTYIASNEWCGKAGGYAIQGLGGAFVPRINGSYSNVVGLPLTETAGLLHSFGLTGTHYT